MGSNVETLHKLMGGQIEALEFNVHASFAYLGIPLKDLPLRNNILVAAITRERQTIIPGGTDEFQIGDRVVVITAGTGMPCHYDDLMDIFLK